MIDSPFSQLRDRYPTASLHAHLLTIHQEQFVVQAQIYCEAQVLATGLAADGCLEAAEDRAWNRALQHLGILADSPPPPAGKSSHQAAPVAIADALPETAEPLSHPESAAASLPPDPERSPSAPPRPAVPAENLQPLPAQAATTESKDDALPSRAEAPQPLPSPVAKPAPRVSSPSPGVESLPVPPAETADNPRDLPDPGGFAENPVDLSDIIAQTDVELRRLGWGVTAGREFLEKTYGKRSRHDLSDEELLEFLLYLESLPDPASSRIS